MRIYQYCLLFDRNGDKAYVNGFIEATVPKNAKQANEIINQIKKQMKITEDCIVLSFSDLGEVEK